MGGNGGGGGGLRVASTQTVHQQRTFPINKEIDSNARGNRGGANERKKK